MTVEEIKELGFEEIEKRTAEIAEETASADAEMLEKLNEELSNLEERKSALNKEVEETRKASKAVAEGAGEVIEKRNEETKMTLKELRNSKQYIDAYAKYVKTGSDRECRRILTENAPAATEDDGLVPVPEFVESRIRQAWENDKIFSRVTKTFIPGILKVGYEASSTNATVHEEGGEAPAEEKLILDTISLVPEMYKKWITVSDEVLALGSEEFLNYIYDEIAYKIIQALAKHAILLVTGAPTTPTQGQIMVPQVTGGVTASTILDAIALLGDGAVNPVIIANGATIAAVKKAALTAGYAYDPFAGLEVIQTENVAVQNTAIVGDLSGIQANLPEGDGVKFKFDDLSLAEQDLVKIVGRLYAAMDIVQPGMFVNIKNA